MKLSDFAIGIEFEISTGQRWRCTDVGQRTIVAIELRQELEAAWYQGPPYPVPEVVFNERGMAAAFRTVEEHILCSRDDSDDGSHPCYPHEAVKAMMKARLREDARRYPRLELLRTDRISSAGEMLHPYAAESTAEGWRILVYAPFAGEFSALPESDFVRLRPVPLASDTPTEG